MTYVEINYKKGPSFSTTLPIDDAIKAKEIALKDAKSWGFIHPVKKITVKQQ